MNEIYIEILIEDHLNFDTLLTESMLDMEAIEKIIKLIGRKVGDNKSANAFILKIIEKVKNIPSKYKIQILQIAFAVISGFTVSQIVINQIPEDVPQNQVVSTQNYVEIDNVEAEDLTFNYPTTITSDFILELKRLEGLSGTNGKPALRAYDIGDGRITIGWGHAKPSSRSKYSIGDHIDINTAEALLKHDIHTAKRGVDRIIQQWVNDAKKHYDIPQSAYESMISVAFNMGVTGLRHTLFVQYVKRGQYDMAAQSLLSTATSSKNPNLSNGLKNRRRAESDWFMKDVPDSQDLKPNVDFIHKKFPYPQ